MPDMPANHNLLELEAQLTARDTALRALVEQWRERARVVRPLEHGPITAEKRARTAEYIWFTNRANELEALLGASAPAGEETTKIKT